MTTLLRLTVAISLALGGVAAWGGPASAAAPQLSISPGPYQPDATVNLVGTGCPSSSPVSVEVWNTAVSGDRLSLDHHADAGLDGSFATSVDLADRYPAGAQIGFFFSCTATVDWDAGPDLAAPPRFGFVALPAPYVEIVAPSRASYGVAREISVRTDSAIGAAELTIDGRPLTPLSSSAYGWYRYRLSASLAAGTHRLRATWDPSAPGTPAVVVTATLVITRITPRLAFVVSTRSTRVGRPISALVRLSATRVSPRTGVVVIRNGRHEVARVSLRVSDAATRLARFALTRSGTRTLRAFYLGSPRLTPAHSTALTVQVRRR